MLESWYQGRQVEVGQVAAQVLVAEGNPTITPPVSEYSARFMPGLRMLVLGIVVLLVGVGLTVASSHESGALRVWLIVVGVLIFIFSPLFFRGLTAVVPGRARVVQLFGRYRGTIRDSGLKWVNPFT